MNTLSKKIINKEKLKKVILFTISVMLLTVNFYNNTFKSANQKWFEYFERYQIRKYGERYVVARLIKAKEDGIFSKGGLVGKYSNTDNHHKIYTENVELKDNQRFSTYNSQIGGQAITFAIIDKITPFSNKTNIELFRLITSFLTATVFSLIILWFYLNFGLSSAIVVFISTLFSKCITGFGGNMFWCLWSFYLPFITVLFLFHFENKGKIILSKLFHLLLFSAVFIKCVYTGYEYITTTLIMMLVPFIFYGVYCNWGIKKWFRRVLFSSLNSVVAVLSTFIILAYQVSFVKGSIKKGFEQIVYSYGKRTSGNPDDFPEVYRKSLDSDISVVLYKYWNGKAYNMIDYGEFIMIFLFFSALVFISSKYSKRIALNRKKNIALVVATWFSILAPLSWFVIFKGHSYIHTGMNIITWHMPFTLFGFGVIGVVLIPFIRDKFWRIEKIHK